MSTTRTALLSVSDPTGLLDLAHGLRRLGFELLTTRGTADHLTGGGLEVRRLEELTGFAELVGGRVKTLHALVHAAILARSNGTDFDELAGLDVTPIELVVVNLYPFAQALAGGKAGDELWEEIDIGGVALLRAGAKNYARVGVVCDPADYPAVLDELQAGGHLSAGTRRRLAAKVFRLTAAYDALIAGALGDSEVETLHLERAQALRYGENPHQGAALYRPLGGEVGFRQVQGEGLSYTNLIDADAAWAAALDLPQPGAVIVKHATPCGAAMATSPFEAYEQALACDPLSAYGGVVALNRPVDGELAARLEGQFIEVLLAPAFTPEALQALAAKPRRRVLEARPPENGWELRTVFDGYLRQERDPGGTSEWRVVSRRAPTEVEEASLRFAWRVARHVRSNAVVLAQGTATVGLGAGQMSRVDAVKLAVAKAGERAKGAALASDAFFPFADGVEEAAPAGVRAIVQPGGSIRDWEAIEAADRHGLAMVFTGRRAFRH